MDRFTIDYFRILGISLELAEVNAGSEESLQMQKRLKSMNYTIRVRLHCKRNFPLNIPIELFETTESWHLVYL